MAPAIATYAAGHASDVATTSGPLANLTWGQIAQGITNLFAASQTTATGGDRRGGWRYYPGEGDSDSSTTQWAVISLIYDEILGATTPWFVKDELKFWLAAVQVGDGSACYQPQTGPCDHSDTGGLLLGLRFVGDDLSNSQIHNALVSLDTNWAQDANNTWYGNFGHPYAMWSVYKGLETTIGRYDTTTITHLRSVDCGGDIDSPPACNWWEDYNEWLVANQTTTGNTAGSWIGHGYWTNVLATAFYLPILKPGAVIPMPGDAQPTRRPTPRRIRRPTRRRRQRR